jgi:hypothetical protein
LKQDVAEAEKRYKKTLDKHSKIYRADMRKKIKKLKTSDPKEFGHYTRVKNCIKYLLISREKQI